MTFTYPGIPDQIQLARWAARDFATSVGLTEAAGDDLELVVTELVTNAVRHGKGIVTLTLTAHRGMTMVTVTDQGDGATLPTPEALKQAADDQENGRGLHIVQLLSRRWGARPRHGSHPTSVWCQVPA